jgi:glycosyltransferase involved in cell wall biosynthesis
MTEFVEEGKNGYIFRRGDADDLERTLRRIISNAEGSLALSRTTAYERTSRSMTEDVVHVYCRVLGRKSH